MPPLPFPTLIAPANLSTSFAETASLAASSLVSPGPSTFETCPAINPFQEEVCPVDLNSGVTGGSPFPSGTLFVSTTSATTSQSVLTEAKPVPIKGPATPMKEAEASSPKNMDSCGLADLVLTDDDSFMCEGEGGLLFPVSNTEVLAKIRTAMPGHATFRKPTLEDTEAQHHRTKSTNQRAIQVIYYGFILVPIAAAGCFCSYFWYKRANRIAEMDALRKDFVIEQKRGLKALRLAADLAC